MKGISAMLQEAPPSWPRHPVVTADCRAMWTRSSGAFWMVLGEDGGTFWPRLDCEGPVPPWFEYMAEEFLSYLFPDCYHDEERIASEMMKLGIAPDQPFEVFMAFEAFGPSLWQEYDTEIEWELSQVEPWPPEKVGERWGKWWDARVGGVPRGVIRRNPHEEGLCP